MPGPHLIINVMPSYKDVGGSDVWVGTEFDQHALWWVGYHSPQGLESWWQTFDWLLIGWELWKHGAEYPSEASYNEPNPSMTPPDKPKVPTDAWNGIYGDSGILEDWWWSDPMPLENTYMWPKGGAPNKGKGKGNPKGIMHLTKPVYVKGKGKGKGQRKNIGKGKGSKTSLEDVDLKPQAQPVSP